MKLITALLGLSLLASDAPGQSLRQVASRDIKCFSGGKVIFEGQSDPEYPVYLGSQDDHVTFVDLKTHLQTRVGGNCIVTWPHKEGPHH